MNIGKISSLNIQIAMELKMNLKMNTIDIFAINTLVNVTLCTTLI